MCFFILFFWSPACSAETMRANSRVNRGWPTFVPPLPLQVLPAASAPLIRGSQPPEACASLLGEETKEVHCCNERQKPAWTLGGQKGDYSPELVMTTLAQSMKTDWCTPNLNTYLLAFFFPNETRRSKMKEPKVSGGCHWHVSKIIKELNRHLAWKRSQDFYHHLQWKQAEPWGQNTVFFIPGSLNKDRRSLGELHPVLAMKRTGIWPLASRRVAGAIRLGSSHAGASCHGDLSSPHLCIWPKWFLIASTWARVKPRCLK